MWHQLFAGRSAPDSVIDRRRKPPAAGSQCLPWPPCFTVVGQAAKTGDTGVLMPGRTLLLDEPFEGVAPVLSHRLTEVIGTLRNEGMSIILLESDDTHSADPVDRVFRIERGIVTAG
jgi:hypothetical protein